MNEPASIDHLPQDVAMLHGLIRELLAAIQDERRRNEHLTRRLLLKRVYGPRADKLDPHQLSLLDEPLVDSVKQATGGEWQKIGEEIREKLDYTPSSLFVRRIVTAKYVVRFLDRKRTDELKIAELPPEELPKSKAAPGLAADVIISKLVDHLPLYRQEQRYACQGFPSPARRSAAGSPKPPMC